MSECTRAVYDFALCLALRPSLYGYACKLTRDRDEAHDIVQDALLQAFKAWPRFDPKPGITLASATSSWMHQIVHNTFIKHWRRSKVRAHLNVSPQYIQKDIRMQYERFDRAVEPRAPEADGRRTVDGLGDEIEAALADLNPRHRQIVELVGLHGGRYHEVARALDIPIGTVMSSLNRARNRLIARLGPWAAAEYGIADQRESRAEATP